MPTKHVVLDALLPERVELGQRERPRAAEPGHRRGADQDGAGTALDRPLQLLDRLLDDGQGDHRGGEDAVLVVEAPHLVEPLVERVDDDVDRDRIVGSRSSIRLASVGNISERSRPSSFIFSSRGRGLEERRNGAHRLTEEFALALAVGVAELEVLLPGARLGDHREGGVRDVVADLALQRDLGAAVDLARTGRRPCTPWAGTWSAPLAARTDGCPRRTAETGCRPDAKADP